MMWGRLGRIFPWGEMLEMELYLDQLEPVTWNPNIMSEERYNALKEDMRVNGPSMIDPILVSPKSIFHGEAAGKRIEDSLRSERYVIVDGHHRVKAAIELKWRKIRCNVEAIPEAEAKSINFRRNRERGDLDPFKEAALFQSDADAGVTQEKIAEKYGVKRDYVSRRLKFVRMPEDVKEMYEASKTGTKDVPRGTLTPSHLEEIAILEDPEKISELARNVVERSTPVRSTAAIAQNMRRQEKMRKDFLEKMATSKFPKCPLCGEDPENFHFHEQTWVYHYKEGRHTWNLETGETWEQKEKREREEYLKAHPEEAEKIKKEFEEKFKPRGFRYPMNVVQLHRLLEERVLHLLKDMKFLHSVNLTAEYGDGRVIRIEMGDASGKSTSYTETLYGAEKMGKSRLWSHPTWDRMTLGSVHFFVEEKEWKTDKENKIRVDCGTNDEEEMQAIKDWIDALKTHPELPREKRES